MFKRGLDFPLPLFPPFLLKVLLDLEGGNELHGVLHCARE